jgi:hypothetical protein
VEPQSDRATQSVSVEIEGSSIMGQITLWDTGECEVDLGSTIDRNRTLVRSVQVTSNGELLEVLQEAIHSCESEPR